MSFFPASAQRIGPTASVAGPSDAEELIALDHVARRLGRHVARTDAGAAARDDEARSRGGRAQRLRDRGAGLVDAGLTWTDLLNEAVLARCARGCDSACRPSDPSVNAG